MADINVMTFTGRLTADATYAVTSNGKGLLQMNVAVNTGFGQYAKTTFLKVQQWGERGAKVAPYCKKGQLVGGSGELTTSNWTSQNGVPHTDLVVSVLSFQLLGSKKENEAMESKSAPESTKAAETSDFNDVDYQDEEVPF